MTTAWQHRGIWMWRLDRDEEERRQRWSEKKQGPGRQPERPLFAMARAENEPPVTTCSCQLKRWRAMGRDLAIFARA